MARIAAAVLAFLLVPPLAHPQQPNRAAAAETDVETLLSDARSQASLLRSDISTLDFLVAPGGVAQERTAVLQLYREHVTKLRDQATRLSAARQNASRWQRVAIDRIIPLMQEFASSAETAIAVVRTPQDRSGSPEFRKYIKAQSDLGDEFYRLISAWVDYSKTREDLDQAAAKIEGTRTPQNPSQGTLR